jgi:hypothetical protein
MGGGSWSDRDWKDHAVSSSYSSRSVDDVINTKKVDNEFLPTAFKNGRRESRDSTDNPNSTAIIVAGDVTGSMGRLAGLLIKEGLAAFATGLYDRKPITDPHLMGMAVGDARYDRVPLQATQFEADIRIVQQFEKLFVEKGGGNNNSESYHLPWVCAALMTDLDCFEKRGEKGILFTYGDESVPPPLTRDEIQRFLGISVEADISAEDALTMVSRTYDVYHLIIEEGSFCTRNRDMVVSAWTNLLGQNAIPVADHSKLAEIMTSILEVSRKGLDADTVSKTWKGDTAIVVRKAIKDLVPADKNGGGLVAI